MLFIPSYTAHLIDGDGWRSAFLIMGIFAFLVAIVAAQFLKRDPASMIGFAQGGVGTSQSPLAASLFGPRSHGLILGCIGFGNTLGAVIGPLLTGLVSGSTGSYHWALLMCAAASLIALIFATLIPLKH